MFYDNFKDACARKGTNISKVLTEIGRATSNTGGWKAGKFPRMDIIVEMAEYLQISTDELIYGHGRAPYALRMARKNEIESEWVEIITQIPQEKHEMCKDFLRTHMATPEKYADDKRA